MHVWISFILTLIEEVKTHYDIHNYTCRLSELVWISHHVDIQSTATQIIFRQNQVTPSPKQHTHTKEAHCPRAISNLHGSKKNDICHRAQLTPQEIHLHYGLKNAKTISLQKITDFMNSEKLNPQPRNMWSFSVGWHCCCTFISIVIRLVFTAV